MLKTLTAVLLVGMLTMGAVTAALPIQNEFKKMPERKRYLVGGSFDESKLKEGNCTFIKGDETLRVYECDVDIAKELNLMEDQKVYALDSTVNNFLGASKVWEIYTYNDSNSTEVAASASLTSSGGLEIKLNNLSIKAAKYILYASDALTYANWTAIDTFIAPDTPAQVTFLQSIAGKQRFFKLVMIQGELLTGKGRKIAVLDSGMDYNNAELKSSYLGGWDFVNNDPDPMDDNGHGTFVSGVITSDGKIKPASKGIAPDAGIYAIKVLNAQGAGSMSDVYYGIKHVLDNYKVDAINISIGGEAEFSYYCDIDTIPEFVQIFDRAMEENVSIVVAGGNTHLGGVTFPACLNKSFSVGNIYYSDEIYYSSAVGIPIDIYAPGVQVLSVNMYNLYSSQTGTSYSAPVVSGTIALMKQKSPNATAVQIQDTLLSTANKTNSYGWNIFRVNTYNATVNIGAIQ